MKCYIHPDIEAVGTCTSCGKTVCSVCAMDVGGKVVCKQCAEKMAGQAAAAAAAAASSSYTAPSGAPAGGPTPTYAPASSEKNPIVGLIASLIIPGVGQFINGQTKKGIILFVAAFLLWIITSIIFVAVTFVTIGFGFCCGLCFYVLPVIVHIYAAYEAYSTAKKLNAGEFTKDWLS